MAADKLTIFFSILAQSLLLNADISSHQSAAISGSGFIGMEKSTGIPTLPGSVDEEIQAYLSPLYAHRLWLPEEITPERQESLIEVVRNEYFAAARELEEYLNSLDEDDVPDNGVGSITTSSVESPDLPVSSQPYAYFRSESRRFDPESPTIAQDKVNPLIYGIIHQYGQSESRASGTQSNEGHADNENKEEGVSVDKPSETTLNVDQIHARVSEQLEAYARMLRWQEWDQLHFLYKLERMMNIIIATQPDSNNVVYKSKIKFVQLFTDAVNEQKPDSVQLKVIPGFDTVIRPFLSGHGIPVGRVFILKTIIMAAFHMRRFVGDFNELTYADIDRIDQILGFSGRTAGKKSTISPKMNPATRQQLSQWILPSGPNDPDKLNLPESVLVESLPSGIYYFKGCVLALLVEEGQDNTRSYAAQFYTQGQYLHTASADIINVYLKVNRRQWFNNEYNGEVIYINSKAVYEYLFGSDEGPGTKDDDIPVPEGNFDEES